MGYVCYLSSVHFGFEDIFRAFLVRFLGGAQAEGFSRTVSQIIFPNTSKGFPENHPKQTHSLKSSQKSSKTLRTLGPLRQNAKNLQSMFLKAGVAPGQVTGSSFKTL